MSRRLGKRVRWVAPDGRRGRWRKTVQGAVMSAVSARYTGGDITVRFDLRASLALWDGLASDGWILEQEP